MAEIINLNRFRKTRKKAEKAGKAGANRLKFSRTKTKKAEDARETAKHAETVDGAKLDDSDKE